jgi:hypothetical protein
MTRTGIAELQAAETAKFPRSVTARQSLFRKAAFDLVQRAAIDGGHGQTIGETKLKKSNGTAYYSPWRPYH